MIFFTSDYSSGAHQRIIDAIAKTNNEDTEGYSKDPHCAHAEEIIKRLVGRDDADVHFLTGGTITNLIAISAFLKPYEAALAADTGHICVHETGAIEATGHKAIAIPGTDGKVTADAVEECVLSHIDEHMVKPGLLYISDTTETGSIYKKDELIALREVCRKYGMYFYLDGARLGSAITAEGNDVEMKDLAEIFDAFYIGGTKNGFLFGEALVIINPLLKPDFRYMIKQKGGMFAKGRLLGIQFEEMFRDGLYFELAAETNRKAKMLREGIADKGYSFATRSVSNQLFPVFPVSLLKELEKKYAFQYIGRPENGKAQIRLVCSWTTTEDEVKEFLKDI